MFLNIVSSGKKTPDSPKLKKIYDKFHEFIGRGGGDCTIEVMQSAGNASCIDDTFITPASSTGDLMSLSPRTARDADTVHDLLSDTQFDSICDVTMQEVPIRDDMFMDANSLDYLVRCADTNRHHNLIDMGKESLYVKFDPLYSKLKPGQSTHSNSLSSSNDCDVGYETGSSASEKEHVATPKRSASIDCMANNTGRDKPMQRVLPAVKKDLNNTTTIFHSTPALVRSVSAIMTPTHVAIDRLISITGNTPPVDTTIQNEHLSSHQLDHLQSLRSILQKQDKEMIQLRRENRELRVSLQDSEHRISRMNEDTEAKMKKWAEEKETFVEKEGKLLQHLNDKVLSNKQMSIVMEEYEKTISALIAEQQQEKIKTQEVHDQLVAERDDALKHLSNMELCFNDLLSKYEKSKSVLLESKEREKLLMQKISDYEADLKKYESLYSNLKEVTNESLNTANETLDNLKKNHSYEIAKLNANIKKNELTMSSLQDSLTQKTRENEELSRICDQLINAVR